MKELELIQNLITTAHCHKQNCKDEHCGVSIYWIRAACYKIAYNIENDYTRNMAIREIESAALL